MLSIKRITHKNFKMIYIPFTYFLIYFLFTYKRNKTIYNIGEIITIFYIVSSLFSIMIFKTDLWSQSQYGSFPKMDMLPTILYCTLLTICIEPFSKLQLRDVSVEGFDSNNKIFRIASWILVILSILFLLMDFSLIVSALTGDFSRIRHMYYAGEIDKSVPVYMLPSYYAKQFSPILLLFFFYSLLFEENSRIFSIMLLVASLVQPLSSMLSASRTEVVYWIMTTIILYIIFYKKMTNRNKTVVLTLLTIIVIAAVLYLSLVTESRFSYRSYGTSGGLILYIGQPYLQFCKIFEQYTFDGQIHFGRTFPILYAFINGSRFDVQAYRVYQSIRIGAETGVFLTFLGDAMLDFGKIGMVVYAIVVRGITNKAIKRINSGDFTLSSLIILTLLFRIPLLGIFAYMYLAINTSVMVIGSIALAIIFSKVRITIGSR